MAEEEINKRQRIADMMKLEISAGTRNLSLSPPCPGVAGLGLIGRRLTKNLLAKGVCQKFRKNYFFSEICDSMPSTRQFGYNKRGFFGFIHGKRSPKPFF
jgi:hypothetical protein